MRGPQVVVRNAHGIGSTDVWGSHVIYARQVPAISPGMQSAGSVFNPLAIKSNLQKSSCESARQLLAKALPLFAVAANAEGAHQVLSMTS